jgi:hypothetical protein
MWPNLILIDGQIEIDGCEFDSINLVVKERIHQLSEIVVQNSKLHDTLNLADVSVRRVALVNLTVTGVVGKILNLEGFESFTLEGSSFIDLFVRLQNIFYLNGAPNAQIQFKNNHFENIQVQNLFVMIESDGCEILFQENTFKKLFSYVSESVFDFG